jgi:hypothetical protein
MRVTCWIRAAAGRNRRSKPDSGGHSHRPAGWNGDEAKAMPRRSSASRVREAAHTELKGEWGKSRGRSGERNGW